MFLVVPQGSVPGPLLFIHHASPQSAIASYHGIEIDIYADDTHYTILCLQINEITYLCNKEAALSLMTSGHGTCLSIDYMFQIHLDKSESPDSIIPLNTYWLNFHPLQFVILKSSLTQHFP